MAFGEEPPAELPGVCWARVPQEGLSRRVFRKGESSGSCRLSLRAGAAAGRAAGGLVLPPPLLLSVQMWGAERCCCAWPPSGGFFASLLLLQM